MAIRQLSSFSRRASGLLFHGAVLLSICLSTSHQSNASAARPLWPHRPSVAMLTPCWPAGCSENAPMIVDAGSATGKETSSTVTPVVKRDATAVQGRDVLPNGNHHVDFSSKAFQKVVLYSAVVVGWCLTLVLAQFFFIVMNQVPAAGRGAALELMSSWGSWLYETGYGGLSSNLSSGNLLYAFVSAVSLVLGFFLKMASNIGHILAIWEGAPPTTVLTVCFMIVTIIYFNVALGTVGVLSGESGAMSS